MSKIIAPGGPLYEYTMTIRGTLQAPNAEVVQALVLQQVSLSTILANTVGEIRVDAKETTLQVVRGT